MLKVIILSVFCLLNHYSKSQKIQFEIDTVKSFVYLITLGTKQIYPDGTYSYSGGNKLQIASLKKLSLNAIKNKIKERVENSKPNDTGFIDCHFLYLDDLLHNDSLNYQLLKPIKNNCVLFQHPYSPIKNHFSVFNKMEVSYTIECIEGEWFKVNTNRDFLETILGRSVHMFNISSDNCFLFILYNQISSCYL